MSRNGRNTHLFSKVPYHYRVVVTTCSNMPTGRKKLKRSQLIALMALEGKNILACSEIPQLTDSLKISASEKGSVLVERDRVYRPSVSFLNQ